MKIFRLESKKLHNNEQQPTKSILKEHNINAYHIADGPNSQSFANFNLGAVYLLPVFLAMRQYKLNNILW